MFIGILSSAYKHTRNRFGREIDTKLEYANAVADILNNGGERDAEKNSMEHFQYSLSDVFTRHLPKYRIKCNNLK